MNMCDTRPRWFKYDVQYKKTFLTFFSKIIDTNNNLLSSVWKIKDGVREKWNYKSLWHIISKDNNY